MRSISRLWPLGLLLGVGLLAPPLAAEPVLRGAFLFTAHANFGGNPNTCESPNAPGTNYTVVHDSANTCAAHNALAYGYDPGTGPRPYGFVVQSPGDLDRNCANQFVKDDYIDFDESPNSRNRYTPDACPQQLYDSFIGVKNGGLDYRHATPATRKPKHFPCNPWIVGNAVDPCTPATQVPLPDDNADGQPDGFVNYVPKGMAFRVDVPNGFYRFVGVFGDADNPHAHHVIAEDGGGSAPPADETGWLIGPNRVELVHNFFQGYYGADDHFAATGFEDKLPPTQWGAGINRTPVLHFLDEDGRETSCDANSPVLEVTQGHVRIHILQGSGTGKDSDQRYDWADGGDIVLLEIWQVDGPTIPITPKATVTRSFGAESYVPGVELSVTITAVGVTEPFQVIETVPVGWTVVSAPDATVVGNTITGVIPSDIAYTYVLLPAETPDPGVFSGQYGAGCMIGGASQIPKLKPEITRSFDVPKYLPGVDLTVTLTAAKVFMTVTHIETFPAGWAVVDAAGGTVAENTITFTFAADGAVSYVLTPGPEPNPAPFGGDCGADCLVLGASQIPQEPFQCVPQAEADPPSLIAAFAFGSRNLTVPLHNDPAVSYTMIHQFADSAAAIAALTYNYDPDGAEGPLPPNPYGFEVVYPGSAGHAGWDVFGPFDNSPNSRNRFADNQFEEVYDSFVGLKDWGPGTKLVVSQDPLTELALESCSAATPGSDGQPWATMEDPCSLGLEDRTCGDPPAPCPFPVAGAIWRVDVPNGLYRFCAIVGEADNPHGSRLLAQNGGSGPPAVNPPNSVTLVYNHDQAQWTIGQAKTECLGCGVFARVGFNCRVPPTGDGYSPDPKFINMGFNGKPLPAGTDGVYGTPDDQPPQSPALKVTDGYIRFHVLQANTNDGPGGKDRPADAPPEWVGGRDPNGCDLVILELWKVCPTTGDTHLTGLQIEGPAPGPGVYTATATAKDDNNDGATTILYTFVADNGDGTVLTVGPQLENAAQFDLGPGDWTITATVDDEEGCSDQAADATKSEQIKVCPIEGDTHCQGVEVVGPEGNVEGTYTATVTAVDDSGDAILYTFTIEDGVNPPLVIGPQAENYVQRDLVEGAYTLTVVVDDDLDCADQANDSTCTVTIEVLPAGKPFVRTDSNGSGRTDISDAICILDSMFGPPGAPCRTLVPQCKDAADANDDGKVDLADPVYLLQYLFVSGPAPSAPFPGCGLDKTEDAGGVDLGCDVFQPCAE